MTVHALGRAGRRRIASRFRYWLWLARCSVQAEGRVPSNAGLHVIGNQLQNAGGQTLSCMGSIARVEYAVCKAGHLQWPSDARRVQKIASWHVNAYGCPSRGLCWPSTASIPPIPVRPNRQAIVDYVSC